MQDNFSTIVNIVNISVNINTEKLSFYVKLV